VTRFTPLVASIDGGSAYGGVSLISTLLVVGALTAAPPANDDFDQAAPLGDVPFTVSGTVAEATREPGEPELAVDRPRTVDGVRADGLGVTVTSLRRAGVGVELRVLPATARRLGLSSRVLGRATGVVDEDDPVRRVIRLSRATRRALAGVERLAATVRLEILRSKAPNRVLTRRLTLRP